MFGAALASSAAFLVYLWYESGLYCAVSSTPPSIPVQVNTCSFGMEFANFQFLSIGLLCVFLAAVESVIAWKKHQARALGIVLPELPKQRKLRKTGRSIILIGFLLAVYGLYALNTTMVICPANGCDPGTIWAIYGPLEVSFYVGQIIIAAGSLLVLLAEFVRAKPLETTKILG